MSTTTGSNSSDVAIESAIAAPAAKLRRLMSSMSSCAGSKPRGGRVRLSPQNSNS